MHRSTRSANIAASKLTGYTKDDALMTASGTSLGSFFADAERAAAGRRAAAPPIRPPFFEEDLSSDMPTPEPLLRPP